MKPAGLGMQLLKDKAAQAHYEAEMTRITDELEKNAKVERHPDRVPNDVLDMMPEGPAPVKPEPPVTAGTGQK